MRKASADYSVPVASEPSADSTTSATATSTVSGTADFAAPVKVKTASVPVPSTSTTTISLWVLRPVCSATRSDALIAPRQASSSISRSRTGTTTHSETGATTSDPSGSGWITPRDTKDRMSRACLPGSEPARIASTTGRPFSLREKTPAGEPPMRTVDPSRGHQNASTSRTYLTESQTHATING